MRPDKEFKKDVSNHVHNTEYSLADMITTDEEGGCIMKYLNASVQNATFGLIFGERPSKQPQTDKAHCDYDS